jgi:excisionase family DNA binding protein
MERRFVSMKDLAVYLGVSRYTIRAWVYRDKIPCRRIGRAIRFDMRQIEKIVGKEDRFAQHFV